MTKALNDEGRIALYGLHFATDSATLTPDAKPTLDEMAKVLKTTPSQGVYIVGHTDNSCGMARQTRADAVVKALTTTYGIIAADRLVAKDVASNRSEPGKAKNRRVEMVAQ